MKQLIKRFWAWLTYSKTDEMIKTLKSIDKRLSTLEQCVRQGVKHRPHTSHIVTGHWND
jgi:hypothetical protein